MNGWLIFFLIVAIVTILMLLRRSTIDRQLHVKNYPIELIIRSAGFACFGINPGKEMFIVNRDTTKVYYFKASDLKKVSTLHIKNPSVFDTFKTKIILETNDPNYPMISMHQPLDRIDEIRDLIKKHGDPSVLH